MILYTAIFGTYDTLRPTKFPSVCLTDRRVAPPKGWTIRTVPALKDLSPHMASRHCKLFPWEYFPGAKYSVYFDGNIILSADPSSSVLGWLRKHDLAVFRHPERDCIYVEARACIKYKKGSPEVIEAQMRQYWKEGFPPKYGLAACGVLVRRHTDAIKRFSDLWWQMLLKYSKRDQLSFEYVRWKTGLQYRVLRGNILKGKPTHFRRVRHK